MHTNNNVNNNDNNNNKRQQLYLLQYFLSITSVCIESFCAFIYLLVFNCFPTHQKADSYYNDYEVEVEVSKVRRIR